MNTIYISHLSVLKDIMIGIISTLLVSPIFFSGYTLLFTIGISLVLYRFAVIIELKIAYDRSRITTTI